MNRRGFVVRLLAAPLAFVRVARRRVWQTPLVAVPASNLVRIQGYLPLSSYFRCRCTKPARYGTAHRVPIDCA
jgi:hypothetical protein